MRGIIPSMEQRQWFLGIDGGGTKTETALGFDDTHMRWGLAGPSNPRAVPRSVAVQNILQAIRQAELGSVRNRPYQAVFGIAGLDKPGDFRPMRAILSRTLRGIIRPNFTLVSDVIIALASGTSEQNAAIVISGTGSNALARGPKGQTQAGGRGHRLADEGSGYAQGLAALHAVTKAKDGRGPKTLLTRFVLRHFHIKKLDELMDIVYEPKFGKPQIAALAIYVQFAAEYGDKVAKNILSIAADELALLATTVIKKSGLQRQAFPLVTVGGIFKCPIVLPTRFRAAVRAVAPKVKFVRPDQRPAYGAWVMANNG